jgi:hypothetical protein
MTVDELSRLSDEEGCLNGFYRVSPFMKEAKYNQPIRHESLMPNLMIRHLFLLFKESAGVLELFRPSNGTSTIDSRKMLPSA